MPLTLNRIEAIRKQNQLVYCYLFYVTEHNNDILDDSVGNQIETFIVKIAKDKFDLMTPSQRNKWAKDQVKDNIKVNRQVQKDRQDAIDVLLATPEFTTDADGNSVYKKAWKKQLKDLGYDIRQLPEVG